MGVVTRLDLGPLLKLKAEARPKAAIQVGRFAGLIKVKAMALAPVDTGALRNSIQAIKTGELTWTVSAGMAYAPFVEFGTSRMAAQPFLIPAVESQRQAFADAMKEVVTP